ncbi:hypothetical protein TNCV_3896811 [Trichonephila clavipes]|nr:hypothetical protein TNCV_3896811 [Trichonephila clavipes]
MIPCNTSTYAVRSYAIFKSLRFVFPSPITETQAKSVPTTDEIGNVIEEVVDLARHMKFVVDSDDDQKLLVSNNQELTYDELIEMHEQERKKKLRRT